jgi:hypothetical protein
MSLLPVCPEKLKKAFFLMVVLGFELRAFFVLAR